MELNIQNAIIEVTRKCNMKCEHCLRGAAQRKTISDQHIYKFLQLIDSIGSLTITGGEPTLAMDSLEQIRQCIIYGDCLVNEFYMVTNGKAININKLAEWAYNMKNCCGDFDEYSGIAFSFDMFHTQSLLWEQAEKQRRNFERLQEKMEMEYGIYDDGDNKFIRKHSDNSWSYNSLISEGRAKDFGSRDNSREFFEIEEYKDAISFSETELYLSSNGMIVAGCNWSYDSIDNRKDIRIGHIDDINSTEDLIKAIKAYNRKQERVEQDENTLMEIYQQI